jgi:hypothetical protein
MSTAFQNHLVFVGFHAVNAVDAVDAVDAVNANSNRYNKKQQEFFSTYNTGIPVE